MPDDTTILSLPLILPAQAQKHVTHNEALVQLDLIVQLAVINRTLTTAPALPSLGDRHIVATGATGPWVGQSGRIAMYTAAGWQFTQPLPGWQAYVMAESQMAFFNGLAWIALSDGPFSVGRLGVSATADATNRLSVSSPATLLNHAGAGHQLKLNKAAAGDTASLLFQTGFGGRAEMGTAGSDDFSVKVSADGATFFTALEAAAASGEVTLPQPVRLGGQAADPGAAVDGTLWLNTTTGEIKVRSAGVTLAVGSGGGVGDGDKGDITVSGSGATWTIDAGVVTLAKMADVATDSFLGRDTAGTGTPEVLTPAQARGILNVADGATANAADAVLRDRATHTGTQAAATISDFSEAVDDQVAALVVAGTNMTVTYNDATGTLTFDAAGGGAGTNLSYNAGTRVIASDTGTDATLPLVSSGDAGLAPASGGGTTTFLRADGTWAAPGGGAPGGASGEIQYNDGGAFAGATDVEIEGGQLRLPAIAAPTAPAAGGVKLYGTTRFGPADAILMRPDGKMLPIQTDMGEFNQARYLPHGNSTTALSDGLTINAFTGTATAANIATTNLHTMLRRIEALVTAAAATAIAGIRGAANQYRIGRQAAAPGGFLARIQWAPATGVATATHRAFAGMFNTAAPIDVEPSTRTNIIGMGYDAADANIQIMHNDGSGVATKIDLGASFPVPTTDRSQVYEIILSSPNSLTQSVTYRAIRYDTTDNTIAAEATGTITTNLPAVTQLLAPVVTTSVGGTSSVIGVALFGIMIGTEY